MIKKDPKIAIFGLGHIGLPTAALFAKSGLSVVGVDINKKAVDTVNSGRSHIMEPGLEELVQDAVSKGKLNATLDGINASKDSKIMIIIVPTPVDEFNRSDLLAVKFASETISKSLNRNDLVIVESTVPPRTCETIVIPILEECGLKAGEDFMVACTPERALPNNTIYEMTHNARVIGGINKESSDLAAELYQRITKGEIIKVDNLITAEMVKLMENTFRDVNIALANELAMICEKLGIDAIEAINAANHHPRVNIHTPGPGVGGHCLSIDPYFIVEIADEKGTNADLIKTSRMINESMPNHVCKLVMDALAQSKKSVKNSKLGILGVAYKGNVADARETPAEPLIKFLREKGADVYVYDPYVPDEIIKSLGAKAVEMEKVLNCDCVVLLTDHEQFKKITPEMIKKGVFVCTRPILEPSKFKEKGVIFKGVGRI
jgi:UDP-N-acetyl-D-mannosaminuronic acid dehydrogenase